MADEFAASARRLSAAGTSNDLVTSVEFAPQHARYVRVWIERASSGEPCIDELEVYGPVPGRNLALASAGARARASSLLPGYAIHQVSHLNDGVYGNDHSWIAGARAEAWVEVCLAEAVPVSRVCWSRDRDGVFNDRQILQAEVRVSADGQQWTTAGRVSRRAAPGAPGVRLTLPVDQLHEQTWAGAVRYAFLRERDTWSRLDSKDYLSPLLRDRPARPGGPPYWGRLARLGPLERTLVQLEEMLARLSGRGLDVVREREELAGLRQQAAQPGAADSESLYLAARETKRRLFFRDPTLGGLQAVLFAKRHPLQPSHNYSEHLDSLFAPGGGVCVLRVPRDGQGRWDPASAVVETVFDGSEGIVRHPVADYEAQRVYFAYRPGQPETAGWGLYWHLWSMDVDGRQLRRLTEGPFHDFDPVALPDGGLGFMSTRCASRFLCWEPQAYVLHRMEPDGTGVRRLSWANLSEWDPAVLGDGRVLWTRSEYLDKGADFGHTLWAIRSDGTHPELVFGNNTPYGYGHAREVPGGRELVCTLISHGDHQGPIALIDRASGSSETDAITSLTPDVKPQYQMDRSHAETFRDPEPLSEDHFLVSHNPGRGSHWALYVIDRFGNRELLYMDPGISSKDASPLGPRARPPVLAGTLDSGLAAQGLGELTVQDVYEGLGSSVERGRAKYLQVSQELPAPLERIPTGEYRSSHAGFQDFYATPVHLVQGPARSYLTRSRNALEAHAFRAGSAAAGGGGAVRVTERQGWPSYVAKAVLGTVPIGADGSASFTVPAGRVLYFQLLDADYNELQRMRSVVQLQPGERRSCVGCHENRTAAPGRHAVAAPTRGVRPLDPPPWGPAAFDFERLVQPVLNRECVRCHDGRPEARPDLRGARDSGRVPLSYRALIAGGWVDYFDWTYGARHFKAEPLTFGTVQSRLFSVLGDERHREVKLQSEDLRVLKAWIDLNCPLWPDYRHRMER